MEAGKNLNGVVNEIGRIPSDPSIDLMRLIGRLQHCAPCDRTLQRVGPQLYSQAVAMILEHGTHLKASAYWASEGLATTLFCGHWISPLEPA